MIDFIRSLIDRCYARQYFRLYYQPDNEQARKYQERMKNEQRLKQWLIA
jgi:hypothetical protein